MVLEGGVIEGRKVFANILKYIRMGASSNFGNMFSVLGASAFLPFIPMAPIQVLTNNLLYDFSQVPIPVDAVDEEQVACPRPWNIDEIKRFILYIGPISSIFDYTTFFVMLLVFHCWDPSRASVFQTGWFIESLMTQTLIIHVIRTNEIPFLQSWASWPLTVTTLSIMAFGVWLPYSPLARSLGLTHLPRMYWPILMLTLLGYVSLTQMIKVWAPAEGMDLNSTVFGRLASLRRFAGVGRAPLPMADFRQIPAVFAKSAVHSSHCPCGLVRCREG
jgi:P-type Mg2+ transporter